MPGTTMTSFLLLAFLSLLLLPLVVSIRRSTELFKVKVRGGTTRFVRGRMPQSLLSDIDDVVRGAHIRDADLTVVRRDGRPELRAKGELSGGQLQRLRNVVACYTLPRIAAGGRPARRRARPPQGPGARRARVREPSEPGA